jgi:hypothetical protein
MTYSPAVFALFGMFCLMAMTILPAIGYYLYKRGQGKPGQHLVRYSNGTEEWIDPDDSLRPGSVIIGKK